MCCTKESLGVMNPEGHAAGRHERLTADGAARSHYLADQPQSIHQFTFAALLLTCAIRTTLGAYRQVSPGSALQRRGVTVKDSLPLLAAYARNAGGPNRTPGP